MDNMLGENKNLKDPERKSLTSYGAGISSSESLLSSSLSYSKTNKLIMALYMVTDILEESEPIRHKLRALGLDIISDISLTSDSTHVFNSSLYTGTSICLNKKIYEVVALLEIASSLGMISEMNFNILKKEFIRLKESLENIKKDPNILDLLEEENTLSQNVFERAGPFKGHNNGHQITRIGVQKGSTLLKALSNVKMSDKTNRSPLEKKTLYNNNVKQKEDFTFLKNKRREEIISIIKDKGKNNVNFEGLTITDIKNSAVGELAGCGEKTLQRELVAMVSLGLISKTGSKRWSKYSLN